MQSTERLARRSHAKQLLPRCARDRPPLNEFRPRARRRSRRGSARRADLRPAYPMRHKSNFARRLKLICPVQISAQKYFPFFFSEIVCYLRRPGPIRGTYRDRHIRWAGDAVDARASGARSIAGRFFRERLMRAGRATLLRTAKSCGPGAPMQAPSFAGPASSPTGRGRAEPPQGDGGNQAGSPRRARSKP